MNAIKKEAPALITHKGATKFNSYNANISALNDNQVFSIASNSKRIIMNLYHKGRISRRTLTKLFRLHPEWMEA